MGSLRGRTCVGVILSGLAGICNGPAGGRCNFSCRKEMNRLSSDVALFVTA